MTTSNPGIFQQLRKSISYAKEKKRQDQEVQREEDHLEPYKHVPTHATRDAQNSGPQAFRREQDLQRIREETRKRIEREKIAGFRPGLPRSLSSRMVQGEARAFGFHTPMYSRTCRRHSSSNNGFISPFQGRNNGSSACCADGGELAGNGKGKAVVERLASFEKTTLVDAGCTNGGSQDYGNSSRSSSTQDLELVSNRRTGLSTPATTTTTSSAHRLHPRSRRTSDCSAGRQVVASGSSQAAPHQTIRLVQGGSNASSSTGGQANGTATKNGIPPKETPSPRSKLSISTVPPKDLSAFDFSIVNAAKDIELSHLAPPPGKFHDPEPARATRLSEGEVSDVPTELPPLNHVSPAQQFQQVESNKKDAIVNAFPEPMSQAGPGQAQADDPKGEGKRQGKKLQKTQGKVRKPRRY